MYTQKQTEAINELKRKYSLKNIKTFRSMEGEGFNSTLYKDGKKLCNVDDEGVGGCLDFSDYKVEEALNKELKEKVGTFDYDKTKLEYNAEIFIDDLFNEFQENKMFKKQCKSKTLVITKDCKEGEYIQFKFEYGEKATEFIKSKYKDNLVEIINERFL